MFYKCNKTHDIINNYSFTYQSLI
ncbi:unnamed protein product [Spodoptera exigua]|nr:unnamed protein product [Spodoptera exigua]